MARMWSDITLGQVCWCGRGEWSGCCDACSAGRRLWGAPRRLNETKGKKTDGWTGV